MRFDLPAGYSHYIARNKLSLNVCRYGCAYAIKGEKVQQLVFESNEYDYLFSLEGGAVYSGKLLSLNKNSETPFLAMFKNEVIKNSIGAAIDIMSINDAGVIIFDNCTFYNNLGANGASIKMD